MSSTGLPHFDKWRKQREILSIFVYELINSIFQILLDTFGQNWNFLVVRNHKRAKLCHLQLKVNNFTNLSLSHLSNVFLSNVPRYGNIWDRQPDRLIISMDLDNYVNSEREKMPEFCLVYGSTLQQSQAKRFCFDLIMFTISLFSSSFIKLNYFRNRYSFFIQAHC